MATTFLSDSVISSTEFRAKQKHWLDKAASSVVTIVNGRKKLALMSRERMSNLYAQKHYSELLVRYCHEMEQNKKSDVFPWAVHLDTNEKLEFRNELINTMMTAIVTENWQSMEELIEDWKATAEANGNPAIRESLLAEEDASGYVSIRE